MKYWAGLLLTVAAFAEAPIRPELYKKDVKFLASPKLKGRGDGSPELNRAADYIAGQFRSFGLQPGAGSGYFQDFEITTASRLGPANRLAINGAALTVQKDFQPFTFSESASVTAPVVFAGYGITAPEYKYDDYSGIDVKDKLVLILRHEPQEFDDKSVFSGRVYTEHAQLFSKATNAKLHGARGVLVVNDIANHQADGDVLERFGAAAGPGNAGIPFVQITVAAADQLLKNGQHSVRQLSESIDKDLKPQSFPVEGATISLEADLRRENRSVHNVLGYLPGSTNEYIIVGAHYDHLGMGEQYSLAPKAVGTIHPGADDNASGTAGVIELARHFAGQSKPRRGILFMAFAGEEIGLLGSSYWTKNPTMDPKQAVAMINMDMIGRIRDGKVFIGGLKTGSSFETIVKEAGANSGLQLDVSEQAAYGSSDHTSFYARQIPSLFFFSGLHGDYHKPSDTWDKIDATAASRLLMVISGIVERLQSAPDRPQYAKVEPTRNPHGDNMAVAGSTGKSGYGPDFGSIPDFAEVPKGVRFADVRAGSPAAKAGLKGGDILVEFDGKPVGNLYDFTYLLRSKNAGDQVQVKVLRDGKPLEAQVLLTPRR